MTRRGRKPCPEDKLLAPALKPFATQEFLSAQQIGMRPVPGANNPVAVPEETDLRFPSGRARNRD